jgi:hypothetical protein
MTTHPEEALLDPAHARGLLLAASRDPDAKLTFLVTDEPLVPLAVKIPVSVGAGNAVDHERRMLVALAGMSLGELARTVPRCVGSPSSGTGRALVSTALGGRPMTVGYHQWRHTARPAAVAVDFRIAAEWLSAFQQVTECGTARVTWAGDVAQTLTDRWRGDTCLGAAVSRLRAVDRVLGGAHAPVTAVHGDYWFGNVLAHEGRVSGVIDWENGARGWPAEDVAKCRAYLVLTHGPDVADDFRTAYEAEIGGAVPNLALAEMSYAIGLLRQAPLRAFALRHAGIASVTAASFEVAMRRFIETAVRASR